MKTVVRLLPWLLLCAAIVFLGLDYRTLSILRSENEGWRATLQAREAAVNLDRTVEQAKEGEMIRLRAEVEQLPKLRGELMRLRGATGEVTRWQQEGQRLAAENERLRTASASAATAASPALAPVSGLVPREQFAFVGYGTPVAALQSVLWGMGQGDLKSMLAGMTPEMQALGQKDWANKTELEVAEELKRGSQKLASFQVLKTEPGEDGTITLTVFMGGSEATQKMKFRRVGEEWKLSPK